MPELAKMLVYICCYWLDIVDKMKSQENVLDKNQLWCWDIRRKTWAAVKAELIKVQQNKNKLHNNNKWHDM